MTTPAISKDMQQYTQGNSYVVFNGAQGPNIGGTQLTRVSQESRPASKLNRKSSSNWRQPSSWSHSIYEATPCPIGGHFRSNSKAAVDRGHPEDGQYYFDGAGWTATTSSLPAFPGDLHDRAVTKALSKLKDQKVNLAQAFFEREQTARLFASTARTIARSVSAFRRGNPKKIWDVIVENEGRRRRTVPRKWLELQYGWKPLMSDLYGSADALRESEGDGKSYRIDVTGVARSTEKISWKKGIAPAPGALWIPVRGSVTSLSKVHLTYKLENPLLASLGSLGVTNPAYLVWELLPFSFVVDWFLPLGNWINSMDAAVGYDFLGGTRTSFQKLEESGQGFAGPGGNHSGTWYSSLGYPSYSCRRMSMTRTVYSSSPLPRFPGFKNPLSTGHVLNAIALLAASFR
jgi:hypothetical protein